MFANMRMPFKNTGIFQNWFPAFTGMFFSTPATGF
jgi:hypothetical protein